ncbi:hypothetical protein D3C83_129940 [compost metagenome]
MASMWALRCTGSAMMPAITPGSVWSKSDATSGTPRSRARRRNSSTSSGSASLLVTIVAGPLTSYQNGES